jgi:hypothetical protein
MVAFRAFCAVSYTPTTALDCISVFPGSEYPRWPITFLTFDRAPSGGFFPPVYVRVLNFMLKLSVRALEGVSNYLMACLIRQGRFHFRTLVHIRGLSLELWLIALPLNIPYEIDEVQRTK